MKAFIFVVAAISVATALPARHELHREFQSKLLDKLGFLPKFDDPLHLNDTTIQLETLNITNLSGVASIADSVVTGLSTVTDNVRVNLITLDISVTVTVPRADAEGKYTADAKYNSADLGELHVTGSGAFNGYVKNAQVNVGGRLQVNFITKKVQIKRVRLSAVFDEFHAYGENAAINGQLIDWDALNPQIKPIFDQVLTDNYDEIVVIVTDILNEILGKYTLAELIEIITG